MSIYHELRWSREVVVVSRQIYHRQQVGVGYNVNDIQIALPVLYKAMFC